MQDSVPYYFNRPCHMVQKGNTSEKKGFLYYVSWQFGISPENKTKAKKKNLYIILKVFEEKAH